MDIATSYKLKAIDDNIDITEYKDILGDYDFYEGDRCLMTDESCETTIEDVWKTARGIAELIPNIGFVMEGAIDYYSNGDVDEFILTVKDKIINSKHTGEYNLSLFDDYEGYDDFIECFPDTEETLSEEDFKRFEGKEIWVRAGWAPALLKEEIEYIVDEIDFTGTEGDEKKQEYDLDISKVLFYCDNSVSDVAMASFTDCFYKVWRTFVSEMKKKYAECDDAYNPLTCKITDQGFEASIKPLCVPYKEYFCDPEEGDPLGDALDEFQNKYPDIGFKGHIEYSVNTVIWKDGKIEPNGGIYED